MQFGLMARSSVASDRSMTTLSGVAVSSEPTVGVDSETATVGEDVAGMVAVLLAVGDGLGVEEDAMA